MLSGIVLKALCERFTSINALRNEHAPVLNAVLALSTGNRFVSSDKSIEDIAVLVPMPQLSPSMTEGTVAKWLKVRYLPLGMMHMQKQAARCCTQQLCLRSCDV